MKKNLLIFVPFIVILVLIFVFIKFVSYKPKEIQNPPEIKVPEEGEIDVPSNVAIPEDVLKTENASYRNFNLALKDESLDKTFIYVNQNDIVTIKLLALDKDYEIEVKGYNLNIKIEKNLEKMIQFQALNKGDFDIICKNCENKKIGTIIVK